MQFMKQPGYGPNVEAVAPRLPPRHLVVMPVTSADSHDTLLARLEALPASDTAWVGKAPPAGFVPIAPGRASAALGQEFGAVVFDARCGFHADALGAISGTVRAGGLLVLLAPPLAQWPDFDDPDYARIAVSGCDRGAIRGRFLRRLAHIIRADPDTIVLAADEPCPPATAWAPLPAAPVECRTADQRRAVEAVLRLARGRGRRPLVLTADRGRGKSAALGIAAAHLLREGVERIVVTGPRQMAAAQVFAHARAGLSRKQAEEKLVFRPPDELARDPLPDPARLVLVDEAAAIPVPLLERLLERHPRIAFATTVHGYEGTGRGFAVRFHQVLGRRTPRWHGLRLEAPIRWATGDPLERITHRALLLDAAAAPDEAVTAATLDTVSVDTVDRDALAADEGLLRELFGLLVLAHYRTRPFDLRMLLDGPNVHVFAMRHAGHVVGTLLVAIEGGFGPEIAREIWAGRRRPHGHMMPESLAAHAGLVDAPQLRGARIVRVAIHPAAQGRGLGTRLLNTAAEALPQPVDYWGASFGASPALLGFWAGAGYSPVRASVTRSAASGSHSVMVMRPLSTAAGAALYDQARARLAAHLPAQLAQPLRDLEPAIVAELLAGLAFPRTALDEADWGDVLTFALAHRLYEAVPGPLTRLALQALSEPGIHACLTPAERDALIVKVLQKQSWTDTARLIGVPGQADALRLLRNAFAKLISELSPRVIQAQARHFARLSVSQCKDR